MKPSLSPDNIASIAQAVSDGVAAGAATGLHASRDTGHPYPAPLTREELTQVRFRADRAYSEAISGVEHFQATRLLFESIEDIYALLDRLDVPEIDYR